METTGNTILTTGGGSGIGRGLAEAFHAQGNKVIIAGRRQAVLDEVVAANPGMAALTLDIEDRSAITDFVQRVARAHPDLNVLINNAGIMRNETLQTPQSALADCEAMIVTNLLGPIRLTAALLPHFLAKRQATVMTVSSGLAFVPLVATPTYCATKAAIHSYSRSLRAQLKGTSVQVLELIPPYVQTELQGAAQASDPNAMPLADFIAETMHLLKTAPDADEICVERVKPLRFAETTGSYDTIFARLNARH
jgi:uncharacterized oxidoreductase